MFFISIVNFVTFCIIGWLIQDIIYVNEVFFILQYNLGERGLNSGWKLTFLVDPEKIKFEIDEVIKETYSRE